MIDTETTTLPAMTYTKIGAISNGIDGTDLYLLVSSNEDDITPEQAVEFLMPSFYMPCRGPGYPFCESISAVQDQFRPSQVIATVRQRYDN